MAQRAITVHGPKGHGGTHGPMGPCALAVLLHCSVDRDLLLAEHDHDHDVQCDHSCCNWLLDMAEPAVPTLTRPSSTSIVTVSVALVAAMLMVAGPVHGHSVGQ